MERWEDRRFRDLSASLEKRGQIDPSLYDDFNIMRGLRKKDGTGVLVGITRIGNVTGYEREGDKVIPTDGDLIYRGYSVLDLVDDFNTDERLGFEEVSYLLLFGNLPNQDDLDYFRSLLLRAQALPLHFLEDVIFKIPSRNIMNKMMRAILSLYSYDQDPEGDDTENVLRQSISIIAKLPLIMAYTYQAKRHYIDGQSLVIHEPKPDYQTAENILHLIRLDSEFTPQEAKILDLLLILHAEHGGGNNSTFATHVVSSAGTDTYSTMATALGSLKGPRHGGANLMVASMLDDMRDNIRSLDNEADIESYLRKVLAKEAFDGKGLIYGIGHAIYTLTDPRGVLLKDQARDLAKEKGYEDYFNFLEKVEDIGGRLVQEKQGMAYKPCFNVDLYSGFVYKMLGIPRDLYTPLFALARMSGWCAHRLEQVMDSKIIRPAYIHLSADKKYLSLKDR